MSGPFGGPPPPGSYPPPPASYPPPPPAPQYYFGPPSGFNAPPAKSKMGSGAIIAIFVGVLLALALVAGLFVLLNQPPPPVPPCDPAKPCAPIPSLPPVGSSPPPVVTPRPGSSSNPGVPGATLAPVQTPTSDSPVVVAGTLYTDASLGYGFEYDPDRWEIKDTANGSAVLNSSGFDAQIWIDAATADTSTNKMMADELASIDRFIVARTADTDTYDALLGPSIGYVNGDGSVWSGTLVSGDGTPIEPAGVAIVTATDGRITVAVVVVVGTPDARVGGETAEHQVRSLADDLLKTFHWTIQ